uniref:Peptidase S1 domain-containing protein n=1 Tax=Schizaphis graminum TaxID=13262 RepID=A0A2S2NAE1_SCHGA
MLFRLKIGHLKLTLILSKFQVFRANIVGSSNAPLMLFRMIFYIYIFVVWIKLFLISEQGVREGDSGAGLMFLHNNSYYLTGVMSVKDPNSNDTVAVFTDIKFHIQWLRELFINNLF